MYTCSRARPVALSQHGSAVLRCFDTFSRPRRTLASITDCTNPYLVYLLHDSALPWLDPSFRVTLVVAMSLFLNERSCDDANHSI
jgi:hypothetical protein